MEGGKMLPTKIRYLPYPVCQWFATQFLFDNHVCAGAEF